MTAALSLLTLVCCPLLAMGCGAGAGSAPARTALEALPEQGVARFVWVSAECSDGGLPLSRVGFERTLHLQRAGESLRATYDTHFVAPSCASTEVWRLTPQAGDYFQFQPQAVISLPVDVACGAPARLAERGTLRATDDTVEEVRFASPWCRGYDVRFVYQRATAVPLQDEALLRRHFAHWNRRDAAEVAATFAEDGTFIEPMTRTSDGQPARHEGRPTIRAWFSQAFSTTPWLALQLRSLEPQSLAGDAGARRWLATFRYMDPRSREPARGRLLFQLVGQDILSAELQWLQVPRLREATAADDDTAVPARPVGEHTSP